MKKIEISILSVTHSGCPLADTSYATEQSHFVLPKDMAYNLWYTF